MFQGYFMACETGFCQKKENWLLQQRFCSGDSSLQRAKRFSMLVDNSLSRLLFDNLSEINTAAALMCSSVAKDLGLLAVFVGSVT